MEVIDISPKILHKTALFLKRGGVVICPTDTVYGFLADATNSRAVSKIYRIKKRPISKPLSLFVKDLKMAKEIAIIGKQQEKILKEFWPGKTTVVLVRQPHKKLYGLKKDTVAIRIPNHPFLLKLLKRIDRPLVQTSVNASGQEPLNSKEAILTTFKKSRLIGFIIDGGDIKNALLASATQKALQAGKPSRIVDLTTSKLTRLR